MDIEDYVYKKSGRGYKVQCQCLNCEKEFWVRWSVIKSGGGKYCSYDCTNQHRYYNDSELQKYETRIGDDRHIYVKIICKNCGEEDWERWKRVKEGLGRFCSTACFNKHTASSRRKNYGKENAAFSWDSSKGAWNAYWKTLDGISHTTTKAKWLWEIAYDDVPDGYVVTYIDRNPKNCELDNLEIITRGERTSEALIGHKVSDETRKKISVGHTGTDTWGGFIKEKNYPGFSKRLKKHIKERDNYECQSCYCDLKGSNRARVHHIDGDKKNPDPANLVLVCISCHSLIHSKKEVTQEILEYRRKLK